MARTITYNENLPLQRVYRYSAAGAFSSNLSATTSFNYFNTGVVGDIIYFGLDSPYIKFGDLTLNVGTALVASSITIAWEYWNGAAWATLTVTDGTNKFQNSGVCVVAFTPPTNWTYTTINAVAATWIRARITAVSGLTVAPANATDVPKSRTLAITLSDPGVEVTRFASVLYDASIAGGWGVVENIGATYKFNCHIFLGYVDDADVTNVSDYSRNIEFVGIIVGKKPGPFMTLGQLVSNTDKTSKNGCTLTKLASGNLNNWFASTEGVKIIAYSSLFNCAPKSIVKSYNSIVNASSFHGKYGATDGPIIYNTQYQIGRPDFASNSLAPNTDINGVVTSGTSYALRFDFSDYIKGLVNLGCTYLGDCSLSKQVNTVLINPKSDTWDIFWSAGASYGNAISAKYETSFVVKDAAGSAIESVNIAGFNDAGHPALYVENGRSTASIASAGTAITLDTDNYIIGDYVSVGSEIVQLTSGSYPTYTISRGQNGTTALVHASRQALKNYLVDQTDINGESNTYLVEAFMLNYGSGSAPGTTIKTDKGPFQFTFRKYGYVEFVLSMIILAPVLDTGIVLQVNVFIVASELAASAITGVSIDGATNHITLSSSRTLQELYDYSMWWAAQPANIGYEVPLSTSDGIAFSLRNGWTIINGVGVDLTGGFLFGGIVEFSAVGSYVTHLGEATLEFTAATGTYDLSASEITGAIELINSGGGSITVKLPYGTTAVNTGPNITLSLQKTVSISIPNLINGTRVRIYNETDSVELDNSVVSGGAGYALSYIYTGNKTISVKACYQSGLSAKTPLILSGLITEAGATFLDVQVDDDFYIAIGLDGSLVDSSNGGELTANFADIEIDVTDPDGTMDSRRALSWWRYIITTSYGIAQYNPAAIIYNPDEHNILVDGPLTVKNVNTSPLTITNGIWKRVDGVSIIAPDSNTVHWVPDGRVYSDSSSRATLLEVWGRLGLDPTKPLITRATNISFGDVTMAMTEEPGQVTVTRE